MNFNEINQIWMPTCFFWEVSLFLVSVFLAWIQQPASIEQPFLL